MIGGTSGEEVQRDTLSGNVRQKKATIDGVLMELEATKEKLENCHEQMRRLIGMHQNLRAEFDAFKAQRAIELNAMVNGGPTQRLDADN